MKNMEEMSIPCIIPRFRVIPILDVCVITIIPPVIHEPFPITTLSVTVLHSGQSIFCDQQCPHLFFNLNMLLCHMSRIMKMISLSFHAALGLPTIGVSVMPKRRKYPKCGSNLNWRVTGKHMSPFNCIGVLATSHRYTMSLVGPCESFRARKLARSCVH